MGLFPLNYYVADIQSGSTGVNMNPGGTALGAADVNGDGTPDAFIGKESAQGDTYIPFGGSGVGQQGPINLLKLNGINGVHIPGKQMYDTSGSSVGSLGDVNGDGKEDFFIGSQFAPGGNIQGEGYVMFGPLAATNGTFFLSSLNGSNGFKIAGIQIGTYGYSFAGVDINHDGLKDVAIGSQGGSVFIVYGNRNFGSTVSLSLLSGSDGFQIAAERPDSGLGHALASGDFNGDGKDDLGIGAPQQDALNTFGSGMVYILYGVDGGPNGGNAKIFNLTQIDGNNGIRAYGLNSGEATGTSLALGDVNGDGFDDLLAGAPQKKGGTGKVYVLAGRADLGKDSQGNVTLALATQIFGENNGDLLGTAVSTGDLNHDGVADLFLGAPKANSAGTVYTLYGSTNFNNPSNITLADLTADKGFRILGADTNAGQAVKGVGDFNRDGINDLLLTSTQQVSVIFGRSLTPVSKPPLVAPNSNPTNNPSTQPNVVSSASTPSNPWTFTASTLSLFGSAVKLFQWHPRHYFPTLESLQNHWRVNFTTQSPTKSVSASHIQRDDDTLKEHEESTMGFTSMIQPFMLLTTFALASIVKGKSTPSKDFKNVWEDRRLYGEDLRQKKQSLMKQIVRNEHHIQTLAEKGYMDEATKKSLEFYNQHSEGVIEDFKEGVTRLGDFKDVEYTQKYIQAVIKQTEVMKGRKLKATTIDLMKRQLLSSLEEMERAKEFRAKRLLIKEVKSEVQAFESGKTTMGDLDKAFAVKHLIQNS